MENVQAAISTPSAAPAKVLATESPVDDEGAPLRGAFLAVLTQQVKSLKVGSGTGANGVDVSASDTIAVQDAAASALAAEPAATGLPILTALPPELAPATVPAATAAEAAAEAAAVTAAPPAPPASTARDCATFMIF